ncbi:MAG TPA: MFS transporter [Candidatus Saccharimonadales bacterium]|nr:MFS transporter [Candidatus Saccharimonadales bacterium]
MAINNSKQKLGGNFSKLWVANTISTVGDGALLAAGPLLVASQTQSPVLVAGAVVVQQLPWLLFTLISGVYVDRLNQQKLLIAANVFRAAAIGLVTVAISAHFINVPIIYAALFMLGVGNTFADNSAVTFLTKLVPKHLLTKANARLQAVHTLGRQLAGPPFGAYLFVVAPAAPFGFDAITFVVAALLIGWINVGPSDTKKPTSTNRSMSKEIREGFSWLWNTPLLRTVAVSSGMINLASMASMASFVLFAEQQLKLNSIEYGVLLSIAAIGGIVGTFVLRPLQHILSDPSLLRASLLTEALIFLAFAFTHSKWLAGALIFLLWFESAIWSTIATSLRQREAPAHLLGRVNSVFNLFRMGGLSIGALVGGLIAQAFGIGAPFLLSGIALLVLSIIMWRHFRIRSESGHL